MSQSPIDEGRYEKLAEDLRAENGALRRAILLLHRIASLVQAAGEIEPTCYALLTGVTAGVGLGLNRAMLFFVDGSDRTSLRGVAAVGPADGVEAEHIWREIQTWDPELEILVEAGLRYLQSPGRLDRAVRSVRVDARGESPVALALRSGRTVEACGTDDLGGLLSIPTAVAAPLRGRGDVHGVLYGDNCFTGSRLDPTRQLVFGLLADQAGRAIENARHFERVSREARTDALTGLGNHGSFMTDLGLAVAASLSSGSPVGLVVLDLDDLKPVNDTRGHLAGDALLADVAARVRSALRAGDAAYRYGGDEFAILLPSADTARSIQVAGRILSEIASTSVTCSAGAASCPADGRDSTALFAAADAALLRAKSRGKNRVEH